MDILHAFVDSEDKFLKDIIKMYDDDHFLRMYPNEFAFNKIVLHVFTIRT